MFSIGQTYTRDEIYAAVGGSKQAYIPTKNGCVVAICVRTDLNPRAPREILCGTGPIIAKAGRALASTTGKVPVFVKQAVNEWEYAGLYRVVGAHTSGTRFHALVSGSGRSPRDISIAIEMAP
jgi:hypothetical protein